MIRLLYAGAPEDEAAYLRHFSEASLELTLEPWSKRQNGAYDFILFDPNGDLSSFDNFRDGLKGIFSLWAGVDKLLARSDLPDVPIMRMVEPGLTQGMVEYVLGFIYFLHLGFPTLRTQQQGRLWRDHRPPLAHERHVGILGLGPLGKACAQACARNHFHVSAWSRSEHHLAGVTCHWGEESLKTVLTQSEILVVLLPETPSTFNLLDKETLSHLPKGAMLINAARGGLIKIDDLVEALDRSQIAHAVLDVFNQEPLAATSPLWDHAKITITPHCASATRPETASKAIIEQLQRWQAKKPFKHQVALNKNSPS